MREICQRFLIPAEDLRDNKRLFFRSETGIVNELGDNRFLLFPAYTSVDCLTYFNGLSVNKWKEYTGCSDFKLSLDVKGKFIISIIGASINSLRPEKKLLYSYEYDLNERSEIEISIPDNNEMLVGFYIDTESVVELYGGYYSAEFPQTRPVNLSLSTTTMKKEEYITNNIKLLYKELLSDDSDIENHLYIHIVDNGRTLSANDFPKHEHIFLHPNKNVGGSGGFARGMIESLEQKEEITHVLLMDDDVRIEPDSIYRTYILLKHMKPEYQGAFISGAMLHLEDPSIQQEDVGFVSNNGCFMPIKQTFNQEYLWDILTNNKKYVKLPRSYAAWWYCCIPIDKIKQYGLPVPLFVRGDDVEYGIRVNPEFITMDGICVWHLGFAGKFNTAMDYYQVNRNMLINRAFGLLDGVDVFKKNLNECRGFLLRFDYDSAELIIRAMEDYLKGPEYIMEDKGEEILKSNMKLVHSMLPMDEMGNPDADIPDKDVYADISSPKWKHFLYKITYNGHRLWPFGYNRDPMIISYNAKYTPHRYAFRQYLYGFNTLNRTGYKLERDNRRFNELWKRFKRADSECKKRDQELKRQYQAAKPKMTSMEFWKNYLRSESIYE